MSSILVLGHRVSPSGGEGADHQPLYYKSFYGQKFVKKSSCDVIGTQNVKIVLILSLGRFWGMMTLTGDISRMKSLSEVG